jgi:hypothetical protein
MLSDVQVKIVFLSLLGREPTDVELNFETSKVNNSIVRLSEQIKSSEEYLILTNTAYGDLSLSNDIVTLSNIISPFQNGVFIGNNNISYITTSDYNVVTSPTIFVDSMPTEFNNPFDVRFFSSNINDSNIGYSNHSQYLNLNTSTFTDSLDITINSSSNYQLFVNKICLDTYRNCIIHSYSLSNLNSYDSEIDCYHLTNLNDVSNYDTNIITIDNVNKYYLSSYTKNELQITNLYDFATTSFVYNGYKQMSSHAQNQYRIRCAGNSSEQFNIITCIQSTKQNKVNNKHILLTLITQTVGNVLHEHNIKWMDTWKRNLNFQYKYFLTKNDLEAAQKYEIKLKLGLYKLYSSGLTDDFMFSIPLLNIIYPERAKELINKYIEFKGNKIQSELFGKNGVYYPPNSQSYSDDFFWNNRYIKSVYKSALISISLWNYFRTSRDTNWLVTIGYPNMKQIADFLSEYVDSDGNITNVISYNMEQQTNNTFINLITYLALKYMTSAINELKYSQNPHYINAAERLRPNVFNLINHEFIIDLTSNNIRDIYIKVVNYNETYRYVLYDSSDNEIGDIASGNFGGTSGYKLKICADTVFHIDSSVSSYPIIFLGSSSTSTYVELPHNGITFDLSSLEPNVTFTGFKYDNRSIHSQLQINFESYFENNAFVIEGQSVTPTNFVENVLKLHNSYTISEPIEYMELFYIFSSILLTENVLADFITSDFKDIMKDTSLYYETKYNNTGLNGIFTSVLEGRLAQFQNTYNYKKNSANKHIVSITNTKRTHPFENNLSTETLYSFMMSLCSFEIHGERLSSGYMRNDYKVLSTSANVFPKQFKNVELNNIGTSQKNYHFNNVLYNDTPFNIIDNSAYSLTLNENSRNMTLFIETTPELESEQSCRLFRNDIDVTTNYLVDGTSNLFLITYDEPDNISTTPIIINELSNIRVVTTFNSSSSPVEKTFSYLRDNTGTSFINPTIYGNASINENKLSIDLMFNTQIEYRYDLLNSFTFNNTFNNSFLTNPIYNPSDLVNSSSVSVSIDTSNIDLSISLSQGRAGIFSVGQITFDMNLENISYVQNTNLPISGNVNSFNMNRNAIFSNAFEYPPSVYRTNMLPEYVYPTYELEIQSDIIKYIPLNLIYSSGNNAFENIGQGNTESTNLREFQESTEINEFLTSNNLHMKNIYPGAYHSIIHTADNQSYLNDELYAIGYNDSNNMMVSESFTSNSFINDVTLCHHFNSFANSNQIDFDRIQAIRTNKSATMIVLDNNDVYAIGFNEKYNLGIQDDNTNKTELTYCSAISNLAHSNNADVVDIHFKDSSTTVQLNNNKLYSIGTNACFSYASSNKTVSLNTFDELVLVNRFLEDSNYTIQKMDGGETYFRFLLSNQNTNSQEWWGFGQNQYGVLGTFFDETNDSDDYLYSHIDTMSRLTEIESLIHGKKFDINYLGPSITNSNNYYLLPHDGITTYHNFLIDTITKDIYMNGITELPSDQTSSYKWKLWDSLNNTTIDDSYKQRFFKLNNHGIFIGFSDSNITYEY